jgi:hypothetical protein
MVGVKLRAFLALRGLLSHSAPMTPATLIVSVLLVVSTVSMPNEDVRAEEAGGTTEGESAQDSDTPEDQQRRAQAILAKLTKKYGQGLIYEIDERLKIVFATDTDQRTLQEIKTFITAHSEALLRDLFTHGKRTYLSVAIPKDWQNKRVTGHFYPGTVDARTIGSNLRHEFTHALHYADQQGLGQTHPIWIMEGLASLYEDSKIVDGHAIPKLNYRLLEIQQEVRDKRFLDWDKLLKLEHKAFTSHHYAQARYMCMYLYRTGRLKEFYDLFTAGFAKDPSGAAAFEAVYGKPLADIQQDWIDWLLKLEPPFKMPGPDRAGLGIEIAQLPDGLRITRIDPTGAAGAAGLLVDDVITSLDGERTYDEDDLVAVLLRHKAGEASALGYRRDGAYAEVGVTFSAYPKPPKAETP